MNTVHDNGRMRGASIAAHVAGVLLALWLLGTPRAACADLGGFEITRYHTQLTVETNGDLLVEERLDVDFSQRRHGIYRTVPVHYTDRYGLAYSFGLDHVEVTDGSGALHETRVRREGRYVNIRIGDPDRTVRGPVRYVIRYRVRGALRHFDAFDELYWNAIGPEWQAQVRSANAVVRLPVALPADSLQTHAYVGAFGSREEAVDITVGDPDGVVHFDVRRALGPREGVTVVVAFPRGYVAQPNSVVRATRAVLNNWILAVPLVVAFLLWRVYRRFGRDPETRSVAVRYEPPPGISPGGVGTIVDEKVDTRDITATIVDLAVRGFLTIETEELSHMWGLKKKDVTVFQRREPPQGELRPHEASVLAAVFARGDRVTTHDLREKFYRRVPKIKNDLYAHLTREGLFAANPSTVRAKVVGGGIVAAAVVFGLGAAWVKIRGGILPHAFIAPGAAAGLTALLFVAFSPAMPRRTRKGARVRTWALGFQEFAQRVEQPRLEKLEARTVFESLLPHAIALGVSASWAQRFEGIYDEQPPRWYVGHHGAWQSTHAFESSLSDAMSTAEQSMLTSPRSSGSGGGGFSGGGGGGGGGGSW